MSSSSRISSRSPALALHEVEADPHRLERKQQVREEDRGIDLDAPPGWSVTSCEIGRSAQLEERVTSSGRAPRTARLTHEPDWRSVDRQEAASADKSRAGISQWVTLRRGAREADGSSSQAANFNSAPSSRLG